MLPDNRSEATPYDDILPRVTRPARYLGGEWNAVRKDHRSVEVLFALAFPEIYEVGMSHLGSMILYHELNLRPDVACERVFCPWIDMEEEMRRRGLGLHALESGRPVAEFDIVGISLQYEMNYSNVLNLLDLAGLPLRADRRDAGHPLVLAGGPCAFNPEPLADYLDAVVLGEGEEVVHEVVDAFRRWKRAGKGRDALLRSLAEIPGVYVPSLYQVDYHPDGTVAEVSPKIAGVPPRVVRRALPRLDDRDYPTRPIVPYLETVHDRAMVEIFRGCTRGCRFCQAGIIYRPVRERPADRVQELARELVGATGHQEVSLASLSASDYSAIEEVARRLVDEGVGLGVGISLPSLRSDAFSVELAHQVQRVRKTGLTFAPEAGTQRLRDVINKQITSDDLRAAVESAFRNGWRTLKLYFMIGLPTEDYPDLDGIAELVREVEAAYRTVKRGGGPPLKLSVSVAPFVPKPHTPFQWEPQLLLEELRKRQEYLRRRIPRRVRLSWHDPELSFVEAVFARGDRRLARALEIAWEGGAKFDSWSEHFSYRRWMDAFAAAGHDPRWYANRERPREEVFPWDHLETGVSKDYLWQERRRAWKGELTADCRFAACPGCGVCDRLGLSPVTGHAAAGEGS
jgi:radical SAM family uncharacterized protein